MSTVKKKRLADTPDFRKVYALLRMKKAIDRAISTPHRFEKDAAIRWASAWGSVNGIHPIVTI